MSYFNFTIDEDGITPFVRSWLRNNPRMISSVLKSAGYHVQVELKKASRGQITPRTWRKRWDVSRRRLIDPEAPRVWYGKLKNALGYSYDTASQSVDIGWTSKTSAMEGDIQEEGIQRPVTPFVRKFFGERGIYFKRTTKFLDVPARPFIEPKYNEIRGQIPTFINKRVQEYIDNGGFTKNVGKGRKYTVYR